MGFLYVPGMAASNSDCTLPLVSTIELFVTSSGTPTPRPLSWRGWKTRPWIARLSGTISNPSMADAGVDAWISSLAATRASRSASRGSSLGQMIRDTCGLTCSEFGALSALDICSAKMSQLTLGLDSTPCFETFTALAQGLRRASLARRKSVRRTCGSGCSSSLNWPTARAEDSEQTGGHRGAADTLNSAMVKWNTPSANPEMPNTNCNQTDKAGSLAGHAGAWATPNAHDGRRQTDDHSTQGANLLRDAAQWQTPATDSFRSRGGERKDEMGLDQQARFFPTPAARDAKGANGAEHLDNGTGRKHLDQLPNYISHSFRLDPETPTDGGQCSQPRPKLNPLFVEWLMGWPLHWTDCGAVVTASFHSWRQRHLFALRRILRGGEKSGLEVA